MSDVGEDFDLGRRRGGLGLRVLLALLVVAAAVAAYVLATGTGTRTSGVAARGVPSPSVSPGDTAAPSPSDSPSATPAPSATPTGGASPARSVTPRPAVRTSRSPRPTVDAGYPGPGLDLSVKATPVTGNPPGLALDIRVTDTDGVLRSLTVDYGDGTTERVFDGGTPACATVHHSPGPGYRRQPLDRTFHRDHSYTRGGSYTLVVRATTDRPCEGAPVETQSRTLYVTVPDFVPDPSPSG